MDRPVSEPQTSARRVVLRISGDLSAVLTRHLRADPTREHLAFLLATPLETSDGVVLLVRELFLPRPEDLRVRSATRVAPCPNFQSLVYLAAQLTGAVILDVHTHVSKKPPALSTVDYSVARDNADYIVAHFAPPTTLGLVVFNNTLSAHDAVLFDRTRGDFEPITEIQVVGSGLEMRPTGAPTAPAALDDRYTRQELVPGWNQAALANLRIGIVGLGGHGAQVLQTLVSIGAGAQGWIVGVDPDVIEASNLPRIPYATPTDVGRLKVEVAGDFVRRKDPAVTFFPHQCSVTDPEALLRLQACDVLFGCGDKDGVRLVLNNIAVSCGIPFIDLGADIQIGADNVEAGGQVRVVVPGTTACLACCGAIDPGQAALDLLGDADRAVYAQRGYVIGADVGPTPSVAVLNSLVAQYAVTALLALLGSGPFSRWDYLHLDWRTGRTLVATSTPNPDCPACGERGFLFTGTELKAAPSGSEPSWQPVGNGLNQPPTCEPGGVQGD